jgi:hypothetical protein
MRGAFEAAGVDMSNDAWASAFAAHLARCGEDASAHTAHPRLVTAFAERDNLRGSWRFRGYWRRRPYGPRHDVS